MGNVSLSIAALCHAKNLPELETWFRNIIILEWEGGKLDNYVEILRIVKNALIGGKLDKYVGILRIVKNALILINGNKITFHMSVELYPTWELLHTVSGATCRATIQVLSRRVVIYY